jgi:DNA-binding Lrp family transcriptional regulator
VVEYDVLKAMNRNASSDFASIDRAIGAERGRSNYAYHRLLDRGIIKRATINMENLHSKFDVLLVMDIVNMKKWEPARTELLLDVIRWNKRHSDKYSFACDIMAPKGMLALTHVFEGEDLEEASGELAGKMTGAKIDSMIITKTLIGSAENRLYDQEQTVQYEILISDYNYTQDMIRRALGN